MRLSNCQIDDLIAEFLKGTTFRKYGDTFEMPDNFGWRIGVRIANHDNKNRSQLKEDARRISINSIHLPSQHRSVYCSTCIDQDNPAFGIMMIHGVDG